MAATKALQTRYFLGDTNEAPITGGATIFQGQALGYTGNPLTVRPLVAGDLFAGFAEDTYHTSLGAVTARFKDKGAAILTITGLATNTPIGTSVYASDDNTFTLTSSGNSLVGKVRQLNSATQAVVEFNAPLLG